MALKDGTTSPSPLVTREFPTDIGVSSQRINNIMSFDEKQLITTEVTLLHCLIKWELCTLTP